jgi:DNA repair exonuclease SbcCD ATPase subunit
MKPASLSLPALLAISLYGLFPVGADAQTARPNSAGAGAQALQQLQQLASERTALQAENSRLKADLEQARKERDSLKAAQDAQARRSRGAEADLLRSQGEVARLEGDVAREKQRFEELVARFRETADAMREVETDRAAKSQSLLQREQELQVCVDRNRKLYSLGTEVIGKLEDQGFWSALARREPFTRLKRVELENLADGYRDTASDNRLPEPARP